MIKQWLMHLAKQCALFVVGLTCLAALFFALEAWVWFRWLFCIAFFGTLLAGWAIESYSTFVKEAKKESALAALLDEEDGE